MTLIEWTDRTCNPIVVEGGGWWCAPCDEQCANCYAEKGNGNPFLGGNGRSYGGDPPPLLLRQDRIDRWPRLRKPQRIFVCSMTDVFGGWIPQDWHFSLLDGMAAAPRQTFQLLTKRPAVALDAITKWLQLRNLSILPSHIWVGVSVGNQLRANQRRSFMAEIPAVVKFVSYEPALGLIDWSGWEFLSWLIAGGESGKAARPSSLLWYRQARDWCAARGIPFFFKQNGEWLACEEGKVPNIKEGARIYKFFDSPYVSVRVGKRLSGKLLDGCLHQEFPSSTPKSATLPQLVGACR
jgi:protein gp37